MKKILISWFTLLLFISAYSQGIDTPSSVSYNWEDKFNKAEYAFEGIIIKKSAYFRDNKPVSSDIVRVTKVFRGNLKLGKVEIVNCIMGAFKERSANDSVLKKHKTDSLCIFFCKVSNKLPYDPKYNIDVVDNKVLLSDYENDCGYSNKLPYSRIERTGYGYRGVPDKYHTKAQVYQFLKKYPNLKIPDYAEPEPVDTKLNRVTFGHHYSKHESDSLARIRYPKAFDSKGKFIGYGYYYHLNKAKNDSINGTNDTIKKKRLIKTSHGNELFVIDSTKTTKRPASKINTIVNNKAVLKSALASQIPQLKSAADVPYLHILYDGDDYTAQTIPLTKGDEIQLDYDDPDYITEISDSWSSTNSSVASVDEYTGKVITHSAGQTTIVLSLYCSYTTWDFCSDGSDDICEVTEYGTLEASCDINVSNPVQVNSVFIQYNGNDYTNKNVLIENNSDITLNASIRPTNAEYTDIYWSSDNTNSVSFGDETNYTSPTPTAYIGTPGTAHIT